MDLFKKVYTVVSSIQNENDKGKTGSIATESSIHEVISVSTFLLVIDSFWIEVLSSALQCLCYASIVPFSMLQILAICSVFFQFTVFKVIKFLQEKKKAFSKVNNRMWLSITDNFSNVPIMILNFNQITQYLSLSVSNYIDDIFFLFFFIGIEYNKTAEKYFSFSKEVSDSEKFKKKISNFIVENDLVEFNDISPMNKIKPSLLPPNKSSNIQRDLKSYLVRKSVEMQALKLNEKKQSKKNNSQFDVGEVEVLLSYYEGKPFQVSLFFMFSQQSLSLALQLKEIEDEEEERDLNDKNIEDKDKMGVQNNQTINNQYFQQQDQQGMLMNQIQVNYQQSYQQSNTDNKQFRSKLNSYSKLNSSSPKRIIQPNNKYSWSATNQNATNKQLINEEEQEEEDNLLKILQYMWTGMQYQCFNLISLSDSTIINDDLLCFKCSTLFRKWIDVLKLEQDGIKEEITKIIQASQSLESQQIIGIKNELISANERESSLTFFFVSDIYEAVQNHIKIHDLSSFFIVQNHLHSQLQMISVRYSVQIVIFNCIQLIVDTSHEITVKMKGKHPYFNLERQQQPITIQFYQLFPSQQQPQLLADCAVGVRFINIPHSSVFDCYSYSKQSALFFSALKSHLKKVGIVSSLKFTQNSENLRYTLSFILFLDCSLKDSQDKQKLKNNVQKQKQKGQGNDFITNNVISARKLSKHISYEGELNWNKQYQNEQSINNDESKQIEDIFIQKGGLNDKYGNSYQKIIEKRKTEDLFFDNPLSLTDQTLNIPLPQFNQNIANSYKSAIHASLKNNNIDDGDQEYHDHKDSKQTSSFNLLISPFISDRSKLQFNKPDEEEYQSHNLLNPHQSQNKL